MADIKSYSKNSKQIIISFSNELITIENYMLSKKSKNKLIEILDNKLCWKGRYNNVKYMNYYCSKATN